MGKRCFDDLTVEEFSSWIRDRYEINISEISEKFSEENNPAIQYMVFSYLLENDPGNKNIPEFGRKLLSDDSEIIRSSTRGDIQSCDSIAILPFLDDMFEWQGTSLENFAGERQFKAVQEALKNNDISSYEKGKAIQALRNVSRSRAMPLILEFLKNDDVELRQEAVAMIAVMGGLKAIPLLKTFLDDKDEIIRTTAIDCSRGAWRR